MATKKTDAQEKTQQKQKEHEAKVNDPVGTEQQYRKEHLSGEDTEKKVSPDENNEITVHVDNTSEADKDPSTEVPTAVHTEGTGGIEGIAAGSSTNKVVPTGNAGAEVLTPDVGLNTEEAPERKDVRDLQPSAQEAQRKEDEQNNPKDYAVECDGNKEEELSLEEACELAEEKLTSGSSSVILYRKEERFATFVTEEANGQKHIVLKPEDGSIDDNEADCLNKYNLRVITGQAK